MTQIDTKTEQRLQ